MIDDKAVAELNDKVYENGGIDRSHILEFLGLIKTNDSKEIVQQVKKWLEDMHADSKFDKVFFPEGDIEAIIGDLDSYGRVQPQTIMEFKQQHPRTVR